MHMTEEKIEGNKTFHCFAVTGVISCISSTQGVKLVHCMQE
jgi:hypothetical protein